MASTSFGGPMTEREGVKEEIAQRQSRHDHGLQLTEQAIEDQVCDALVSHDVCRRAEDG